MTLFYSKRNLLSSMIGVIIITGSQGAVAEEAKPATSYTKTENEKILSYLPFKDKTDFDNANRNFIATLSSPVIKNSEGNTVIDLSQFDFVKNTTGYPETVNPSLWRQSQLLTINGLFKVTDGIYQVRNIDLANITFIRGNTGWIVIDPLTSVETAKAALDLVNKKIENLPVTGIIYTHSHVDHFAGIRALVKEEDVLSEKIPVIAPEGFMEEAVSENIYAGNVMARRASYMYGNLLPKSPQGNVGSGLGIATASGTVSLIPPNKLISKTGEKATIDGINVEFLMAPDSEAPAEMLFYFPKFKAIDLAEDANHTQHNILTMRGAKVRSAAKWSSYLNQAIEMWGKDAQVSFGSHHWPQWGNQNVVSQLEKQRDLYKYINDQTLRMANMGMTMHEIADKFVLPDNLAKEFTNRSYYGDLKHNVRATYQFYQGWWDANPANLNPYPPVEEAKKYVALIGTNKMIDAAQEAFDQGDYRWAASLANKVVFASPENQQARNLEANALEQLGYQAESASARNFYLTGAKELREGIKATVTPKTVSPDMIKGMTLPMFFDFLAIHLNGPKVGDHHYAFNLIFPDVGEKYTLTVKNGVMNYLPGTAEKVDSTITLDRKTLDKVALGELTLDELLESGQAQIDGQKGKFKEMLSYMDNFYFWFPISEP